MVKNSPCIEDVLFSGNCQSIRQVLAKSQEFEILFVVTNWHIAAKYPSKSHSLTQNQWLNSHTPGWVLKSGQW